jgi:DNA repair protein RecN (Recombination protein N)
MLTYLHIRNLAIVTDLNLECESGMTAITGETGAGKSILIDALSLALGERADSSLVRPGSPRAEIILQFDLQPLPHVHAWLTEHELADTMECLIRRTINADGRSRAYINDQAVTLSQVRELGSLLLDIHGQHAYHSLLNADTHIGILDNFAAHQELCSQVREAFLTWQHTSQQLRALQRSTEERQSRLELLQFQLEELNELELEKNSWEHIVKEHQQLANAEQLVQQAQQVLDYLNGEQVNALVLLQQASHALEKVSAVFSNTQHITELLNNASIYTQEASHDLQQFVDHVTIDPQRLAELDQLMGQMHTLARKHRCQTEQLAEHYLKLQEEYQLLLNADDQQENLKNTLAQHATDYQKLADKLSKQRQKAATQLSKNVTAQLPQLALPHAKFTVELKSQEAFSAQGQETCEFIVQTNPGHPAQPLAKIASGGELSRISLAIQVVTAQTSPTPVLVFDEVDVGISGATASMVGQLLKQLSQHAQILCVTHQPQVAVYAKHHWLVEKKVTDNHTATQIVSLENKERINEIARMLGGIKITAQTLAHAKELLGQV